MVVVVVDVVVDSLIGSSRAEAATKLQLTRLMHGSLSGQTWCTDHLTGVALDLHGLEGVGHSTGRQKHQKHQNVELRPALPILRTLHYLTSVLVYEVGTSTRSLGRSTNLPRAEDLTESEARLEAIFGFVRTAGAGAAVPCPEVQLAELPAAGRPDEPAVGRFAPSLDAAV